jgi:glycine cleavage system H protein
MSGTPGEVIPYRRNHFATRLPSDRLYSRSHFWLVESEPGCWRVGLTGFATRMLGEIVEFDFEVKPEDPVEIAQTVGWIEGFKAVSDLICIAKGRFRRSNPDASEDSELICKRPYGQGWLYEIEGSPDPDAVDVHGYVGFLDATIDKMLEKPWQSPTDFAADPNA